MARILVVDDNDDERRLYARMLYYNGFDVLEADDGVTGVEVAAEERPDLILMDYRLPRLDGLSAAMLLHAAPETAGIPVVCVSGDAVTESTVRAAGCEELIRKPTPIHELVSRIRSYVDSIDDQAPAEVAEQPCIELAD